jgi:hypothetical protein
MTHPHHNSILSSCPLSRGGTFLALLPQQSLRLRKHPFGSAGTIVHTIIYVDNVTQLIIPFGEVILRHVVEETIYERCVR